MTPATPPPVATARRVLGIVGTRTQVLEALRRLDGHTWETLAAGGRPVAA